MNDTTPTPASSQPQPDYLPGYPGKLAQRPDYLDKPEREITPQYIRTYKLDHCLTCSDAEFYGWSGTAAEKAHAAHLDVVDVGPLKGTPCRCPKHTAPITPEDEGIATADVQAQQAADARAYCPDCGHPETNCACG